MNSRRVHVVEIGKIWGYTWQFDVVWHVPRARWEQTFCITRQTILADIRVQEVSITSLAVSDLCGVKLGKYLNFSYFTLSPRDLYIGGPRGDQVYHEVIRTLVVDRTPTNNWSSLIHIRCQVDPNNECLLDINREKHAP